MLLTCATGAYGLAVAEGMLAMTLALCRKLDLYAKNQAEHLWRAEGAITSVWGSTTLVLGLGDIGREYASRMKALGSYTIGIRRNISEKPDYMDELHTMDDLDELLPRADFVAMSLPSTPETRHLMDERRLGLMKKGSYLINAGRGDARGLLRPGPGSPAGGLPGRLRPGRDGAGTPPRGSSPLDAPRAILMPHCAGGFHLPETFEAGGAHRRGEPGTLPGRAQGCDEEHRKARIKNALRNGNFLDSPGRSFYNNLIDKIGGYRV